jgi:hypothetical protein
MLVPRCRVTRSLSCVTSSRMAALSAASEKKRRLRSFAMTQAEQRGQPYLFKLRLTKGVKRAVERAMGEQDWNNAGAGWQGKDGCLRLEGWGRDRRIVILRRRTERSLALSARDGAGQLRLGFAEVDDGCEGSWPGCGRSRSGQSFPANAKPR